MPADPAGAVLPAAAVAGRGLVMAGWQNWAPRAPDAYASGQAYVNCQDPDLTNWQTVYYGVMWPGCGWARRCTTA